MIREAKREEAEILAEVIRGAFAEVARRFGLDKDNAPTHPSNCTGEWIERGMAKGVRFFILEDVGRVCGCVGMEEAGEDLCYLERLAVRLECRRKGFGDALVRRVMEEAGKLGKRRVGIGIIAEHHELRQWYERRGFVETKRFWVKQLPFEVMLMEARISG